MGIFIANFAIILYNRRIVKIMNKRLLSGIKPTGNIHIGNYFGAMRQFLDLQDQYDCYIFLADYHALNQVQNAGELRRQSDEVVKAFLAIGLDPKKLRFFDSQTCRK